TLSAGLALWEGRTGDAREAVAQALDLVAGSDDVWLVAPVLWHGLRAEGDRAERARAVGDPAEARAAARAAAALVTRAAGLHDTAAPAVRPVVAAYESLCRGEEARAAGDPDPEVWAAAARRWTSLDQPYPAAYGRFREAEAVLAGRARSTRAAAALRAAHHAALRLGANRSAATLKRLPSGPLGTSRHRPPRQPAPHHPPPAGAPTVRSTPSRPASATCSHSSSRAAATRRWRPPSSSPRRRPASTCRTS